MKLPSLKAYRPSPEAVTDKGAPPRSEPAPEPAIEQSVAEFDAGETDFPATGLRRAVAAAREGRPSQRAHVRVPFHMKVTLYAEKSFCAGVVLNISEKGAMIACYKPLDVDETVEFDLPFRDESISLRGVVRWNRRRRAGPLQRGMELEFFDLDDGVQGALKCFIEELRQAI